MKIVFKERENLKEKPKGKLTFGDVFTDYMFIMDWEQDIGWHNARIEPYGPMKMNPASLVLHYAQETFEGLKAYMGENERIYLFRPDMNAKRFAKSNKRLAMPEVPQDIFIEAISKLVKLEKDWIPQGKGEYLYIRPFMFANEVCLRVQKAREYRFMVILSPVGAYYPEGVNPIKIYVEDQFTRASKGGTGSIKCGGNYAASILAQAKAKEKGYAEVLWLDGIHRKYVEEVGSMNVMFLIGDTVITAPLDGTILPGITRDSILTLLKDWGYKVEERLLDIEELMEAGKSGNLKEAWGTGTAAVISPIGELYYRGEKIEVNGFKTGQLTQKLYDYLNSLQRGEEDDLHKWRFELV